MKLLTDDQFIEGIAGGIVTAIMYFIKKKISQESNILVILLISWPLLFYIRKMIMNTYFYLKKKHNIEKHSIEVKFPKDQDNIIIITTIIILLTTVYLLTIKGEGYKLEPKSSVSARAVIMIILGIGFWLYGISPP